MANNPFYLDIFIADPFTQQLPLSTSAQMQLTSQVGRGFIKRGKNDVKEILRMKIEADICRETALRADGSTKDYAIQGTVGCIAQLPPLV